MQAAAAVSSSRLSAPNASLVATAKKDVSRRSAVAPSKTSRVAGVTAGSERQYGARSVSLKSASDTMISPGSSRATSAESENRSHSATRNSPVEISIQASAKRVSSSAEERRARATASR